MTHELLGTHKPSQEWYTPAQIKQKVLNTFNTVELIFDPCPQPDKPNNLNDGFCAEFFTLPSGLERQWEQYKYIYCNPPTPAYLWAKKAIETVKLNPETVIIFAAFSEAVLWQINELLDYPICWVRNRINWIDGNERIFILEKDAKSCTYKGKPCLPRLDANNKYSILNPNYMKPSKAPRNYNAFVLLYQKDCFHQGKMAFKKRFAQQFSDLGTVQLDRITYKP
jgi:DNA N-6-adenine-methyltransferase (Dam)